MKKVLMISLLSTAAMMMFATSADATVYKEDKTDVGVSFKADGTVPGENKPYANNLALVWKPGSMSFGEQKAVGGVATFNNTVTDPQYLVVNDDRETLSSWKLSANLSEMKATEGEAVLNSKLTYSLSKIQKYAIGEIDKVTNDFKPALPGDTNLSDYNDGVVTLGETSPVVTLVAGQDESVTMMESKTAATTKGGYATLLTDAKLTATDAKKDLAEGKTFTGQITWTMDDLQP